MSKAARPTLDSLSSRFARKDPGPTDAITPEPEKPSAAPAPSLDEPAPTSPARTKADNRVQILTRIDPATRKRLKVIAAEQERTIQEICEAAIRDFVARHSK